MTTLSAGILLFLIMDPLGNIPLFLAQLRNVAPLRRRRVVIRELIIALVVLFAFLFGGDYVLHASICTANRLALQAASCCSDRCEDDLSATRRYMFGPRRSRAHIVPMASPESLFFSHGCLAADDQLRAGPHRRWSLALFPPGLPRR